MQRALYISFAEAPDVASNRRLQGLTQALLAQPPAGVIDIIPSYTTLYIAYDDRKLSAGALQRWLAAAEAEGAPEGRRVTIPVRYGGADLEAVAARCQLSAGEVIARHSAPEYHVYALGFTPGFPFMGELDPVLALPRRQHPRPSVPPHSVAIAGRQTGIYPLASPGGWHLIGEAGVAVYDPQRDPPFWLAPGDRVRFVPHDALPPPAPAALELLPEAPRHALFEVLEAGLCDLVVDGGRRLAGRFGLAQSGPVDRAAAELANRLLGNPPAAPLLEITLRGPALRALRDGVVAFAGWGVMPQLAGAPQPPFSSFVVRAGQTLRFVPQGRGCRGYLALPGGIESRRFWGSAAVDLRGKIGRPLRAGDRLGSAAPPAHYPRAGRSFTPYRRFGREVVLELEAGPQADAEALEALCCQRFIVRRADRMGIRLGGAEVPGGEVISEATPLGALQVTPAGEPIILLNDRGTLGGYRKPALLTARGLATAAQLRPGDQVRFTRAPRAPQAPLAVEAAMLQR